MQIKVTEKDIAELWERWSDQLEGFKALGWMFMNGDKLEDFTALWVHKRVEEALDRAASTLPKATCALTKDEIEELLNGYPEPSPLRDLSFAIDALVRISGDEGTPWRYMANAVHRAHMRVIRFIEECGTRPVEKPAVEPVAKKSRAKRRPAAASELPMAA